MTRVNCWDRTLTTNGRETDVLLAGLGWSF